MAERLQYERARYRQEWQTFSGQAVLAVGGLLLVALALNHRSDIMRALFPLDSIDWPHRSPDAVATAVPNSSPMGDPNATASPSLPVDALPSDRHARPEPAATSSAVVERRVRRVVPDGSALRYVCGQGEVFDATIQPGRGVEAVNGTDGTFAVGDDEVGLYANGMTHRVDVTGDGAAT